MQVHNPVTSGNEDLHGQVDLVVKKQKGITHLRISQIQIRIHVYNTDELILFALPYHDTHVFVWIVQLLDKDHGKWKFLEGVKIFGAPPPQKVIVQQCVRDMGVFEALCNYASPTKKLQPIRAVISFSTAVIIEVLGSLAVIDTDVIKTVLPYVVSGLQTPSKGNIDHKVRLKRQHFLL